MANIVPAAHVTLEALAGKRQSGMPPRSIGPFEIPLFSAYIWKGIAA
jgi:hypothetical protein